MHLVFKVAFLLFLLIPSFLLKAQHSANYDNGIIRFGPFIPGTKEKEILRVGLGALHERYDEEENMITRKLGGYNYHTDAESGIFHDVRASFNYAVRLLDLGDEKYEDRAFRTIEATIALQDSDPASRYYG